VLKRRTCPRVFVRGRELATMGGGTQALATGPDAAGRSRQEL